MADDGPKVVPGGAVIGFRLGRDVFRDRLGRGAERGPATVDANPKVFISSGWKSPRRTEFFIYNHS